MGDSSRELIRRAMDTPISTSRSQGSGGDGIGGWCGTDVPQKSSNSLIRSVSLPSMITPPPTLIFCLLFGGSRGSRALINGHEDAPEETPARGRYQNLT